MYCITLNTHCPLVAPEKVWTRSLAPVMFTERVGLKAKLEETSAPAFVLFAQPVQPPWPCRLEPTAYDSKSSKNALDAAKPLIVANAREIRQNARIFIIGTLPFQLRPFQSAGLKEEGGLNHKAASQACS